MDARTKPLAGASKLKRISPAELDRVLDRARAERWPELVLLGPGVWLSDRVEEWPHSLKHARRIFHLRTFVDGLASKLASLTGLTSLNLSNNSIGDEGARAIAASLTGLTSLDLSYNNIGGEGARALLDSWSSLHSSSQLLSLNLRNNGDLGGLLPKEVLETTDAQAILAAYRSFVAAKETQTLRPLNELKLIVVGNEAVGKTSLLRYLITGKPRDPNETRTSGIELAWITR